MTSASKAASGMGWLMGGRLATLTISLFSTAILARFLTPQDFGLMVSATITVALANAVFDGAFGIGLVRKVDLDDGHIASIMGAAIAVAVLLTALLLLSAPLIERFYAFPGLALIISATSVVLICKAVFAVCSALLQRRGEFRSMAAISLASAPVGSLLVSVPLAVMGFGVWGLVAGVVVTGVLEAVGSAALARPPMKLRVSRDSIDEIRGIGGMFALNQLLNWAALSGASIVTGHLLGAHALGVYSRSWRLLDIAVSATAGPMQRVFMPVFARLQTDIEEARASFLNSMGVLGPIFAVLGTLACIHARTIVAVLLGGQWVEAVFITQVLFSALVARCLYKLSEGVTVAFGKAGAAARRQTIYAVLMIGGATAGSRFGAPGVAIAASGAVWAFYALSLTFAARLLGCSLAALGIVHLRMIFWAALTLALHLVAALALSELPFLIGDVLSAIAVVGLLLVAFFVSPSAFIGQRTFIERNRLVSKVSGAQKNTAHTELTYIYGQTLPNNSANAVAVIALSDAIAETGMRIQIVSPKEESDTDSIESRFGYRNSVTFKSVGVPRGFLRYPALAFHGIMTNRRSTFVTRMPQVAVLLAVFGRTTVLELHQHLNTFSHWNLWRGILTLAQKRHLTIAALTPSIAAKLDPKVLSNSSRVVVIPTAAEDYERKSCGPTFDVGYVGSFIPGKGVEILESLAMARPNVSFVIYGDHSKGQAVADRLQKLANVTLAGHVSRPEMADALHSFSIGIAPYSSDGFGGDQLPWISMDSLSSLKIVEYMSANRAIISSRIPAVELMVTDGTEALLADPHVLEEWITALDRLLSDTEFAANLAQAARKRFEAEFTMKRRAEAFLGAAQGNRGSVGAQ